MKADVFYELVLGPKIGALRPGTAIAKVEGMPRWTSPMVRITFDDGSSATIPLERES